MTTVQPRPHGERFQNPRFSHPRYPAGVPRHRQTGYAAGIPNQGGWGGARSTFRQERAQWRRDGERDSGRPPPQKKLPFRRTIDYNSSVLRTLEARLYQRDRDDADMILCDSMYSNIITTPSDMSNPITCVTTKFMRQSTNKIRCPIFCVSWTPEGRRLITASSSGEFTLWNGLTFNFETILQAHDSAIRSMIWTHDGLWMLTADHNGFVKYWQSNMNNVKMFQAHKDPIRGLSVSPTDNKFVSGSDDGSVRIFDFSTCEEERILKGHGADVKCVDWHPQKSIIASGSKDSQQPIKLWDARTGASLATIHAHKSTVMCMKWNQNGNWFITASRDHLIKLFDIRNMKSEFQTFKGHQKEATVVAWHPVYEDFFASGGSDGALKFWNVGTDKEVGSNDEAHEGFIWGLDWHPLGHILTSGSNDHSTKFWSRNKPGDSMKDRYNLNLVPTEGEDFDEEHSVLPGMGTGEEFDQIKQANEDKDGIPGLDFVSKNMNSEVFIPEKTRYHSKRIVDRSFAAAWEGRAVPVKEFHKERENRERGPPAPRGQGLLGLGPGSVPPSLLGDGPPQPLLDHPGVSDNRPPELRDSYNEEPNQFNNGPRQNRPPNPFQGPSTNLNAPPGSRNGSAPPSRHHGGPNSSAGGPSGPNRGPSGPNRIAGGPHGAPNGPPRGPNGPRGHRPFFASGPPRHEMRGPPSANFRGPRPRWSGPPRFRGPSPRHTGPRGGRGRSGPY